MRKSFIAIILLITVLLPASLAGCESQDDPADTTPADTTIGDVTEPTDTTTGTSADTTTGTSADTTTGTPADTTAAATDDYVSMDGKKIIFLGNSMLYYGNCVIKGSQSSADLGYFYQICKANGEKVTVTDRTYGSHTLSDFMSKCDGEHCSSPTDHLAGLDLASYDYVVMCQVTNKPELLSVCKKIMKRFTNPNTKFIYMCCTYTYQQNHTTMINLMPTLQKNGITVVNFGELCYNVWKGTKKVPGATLSYNKESFIINGNDANHPNLLTGYIEAMMVYCAITGKSAVGQDYSFINNVKVNSAFNAISFKQSYYTKKTTNFDEIIKSEADMKGLQTLMDEYIKKWGNVYQK